MPSSESFGRADLDHWVTAGIISPAQREAILAESAGRRSALPSALQLPALDVATLLYYFGGLLVLVAYSVFLGLVWEGVGSVGRVVIAALSMAFFAAAAIGLLRSERFRLPGELLAVVAVAITPLLMFAVLDTAGLVPDEPPYSWSWQFSPYRLDGAYGEAWRNYVENLQQVRLTMAAVSLAVAAVAAWRVRSPFLGAAAAVGLGWLAVEVAQTTAGAGTEAFRWGAAQAITMALVGAGLVAVGAALADRTTRDFATWLYGLGLAGLVWGLGTEALDEGGPGWGAAFLVVALLVLALSIPLQRRLFAVVGAGATYIYLGKLMFDVFEGRAAFALVLAGIGLLVVASGILYQRFGDRLFPEWRQVK